MLKLSVSQIVCVFSLLFATAQLSAAPAPGSKVSNGVGMELAFVPSGNFMMGSPRNEKSRGALEQQRSVTLSKGFYIGTTEVTQKQWKAVMGTDINAQRAKGAKPWILKGVGDNYPMYFVSYNEAVQFCVKLSAMEGKKYRMPTEAEWECACRAGNPGAFSDGSGANGWFLKNSRKSIHPVKQLAPNAWGIYDMHGNVKELTSDFWSQKKPMGGTDVKGPMKGNFKVVKGGSWMEAANKGRSAARNFLSPTAMKNNTGFRVVLEQ